MRALASEAGCAVKLKGRAFESKRVRRPPVLTIKGVEVQAVFKILYSWTERLGVSMVKALPFAMCCQSGGTQGRAQQRGG